MDLFSQYLSKYAVLFWTTNGLLEKLYLEHFLVDPAFDFKIEFRDKKWTFWNSVQSQARKREINKTIQL